MYSDVFAYKATCTDMIAPPHWDPGPVADAEAPTEDVLEVVRLFPLSKGAGEVWLLSKEVQFDRICVDAIGEGRGFLAGPELAVAEHGHDT